MNRKNINLCKIFEIECSLKIKIKVYQIFLLFRNVLEEVGYQLKRIYSHPSIVLYSANFETEQALAENWYNFFKKPQFY